MSLDIICSGCESFHEKYMYKLQIFNSSQCNSHFNNTAMTDTFYWCDVSSTHPTYPATADTGVSCRV